MGCKRIPHYPKELKKEIIQKLKDGISRSDIQKEYGISPSSLSRWICPPDEIIGNANEETVQHTPIQPTPVGGRDGDDDDEDVDEDEDENKDDDEDENEDEDEDEDEGEGEEEEEKEEGEDDHSNQSGERGTAR